MPKQINAEGVTRTTLFMVPPEQIQVIDTDNGRRFKTDVEDLALDIAEHGQLEAILCRRDEEGKLVVVAGYRRLAAIKFVNESGLVSTPLKVKVDVLNVDEVGAFMVNVSENHQRQNLSPIDTAYAIQRLKVMGKLQSEIAKLFGKSEGWISQQLGLLNLPVKIQQKVHDGKIPSSVAYQASTIADEAERDKVLEQAAAGQMTGQEVVERKARKKAEESGEAKPRTSKLVHRFFEEIRAELAAERKEAEQEELTQLESFAKELIGWLDGKLSDRQMRNRLDKTFPA